MSTVSHVLNGRPGFAEDTQQRVQQAARELGYLPNHLGRALVGGKSMSIGLMGELLKSPIRLLRMRQIELMSLSVIGMCYIDVKVYCNVVNTMDSIPHDNVMSMWWAFFLLNSFVRPRLDVLIGITFYFVRMMRSPRWGAINDFEK